MRGGWNDPHARGRDLSAATLVRPVIACFEVTYAPIATLAPDSRKARAVASPSPPAPPVIKMLRPVKSVMAAPHLSCENRHLGRVDPEKSTEPYIRYLHRAIVAFAVVTAVGRGSAVDL